MRSNLSLRQLVLVSMMFASFASAKTNSVSSGAKIEPPKGESLNRFGVSYRMGFNISARFKNLGGFPALSNPGPATSGVDHTYDDGYNRVDSSGNTGGATWFWGYENASQLPGNDTVVMSSSSSAATGKLTRDEDPQHGIEISYARELGRSESCKWGIETAFNFTDVTMGDNRTIFGSVTKTNDAYSLGGTIPPAAPYSHGRDPSGSDPLINDTPIRNVTTLSRGALVAGSRQFDAEIYGLRVGPYVEIPLSEHVSFSLSGGFTLLSVNSDFKYRETVTLTGVGTRTTSGNGSRSEWMPGGYVGGNFNYAVAENVKLFAGAQYQAAGTYSHKENGKKVELDLGNSVFVNLGVGFSF